jgi:putative ABC transport system permease protein
MDLVFVGILFVAAAAGIANTMMMSTFERRSEFGMLLALGARPRRLVRMILLEAVVLGLVGVAIGSALGAALVLVTSRTGIDYAALTGTGAEEASFAGLNLSFVVYPRLQARHVWIGTLAVTLTSALASVWPAALVARLQPAEAMRS